MPDDEPAEMEESVTPRPRRPQRNRPDRIDPNAPEAPQGELNENGETVAAPRFFELPEERYRGPGQPLMHESWEFRPYSFSTFVGFIHGGTLIKNWVDQGNGVIGGIRLGWDFDYYWGTEMRFAMANPEVYDDPAALVPGAIANSRNNDLVLWDINLCYYPWGDSRWRPYATLGAGTSHVHFTDILGDDYKRTVFEMPFGVGIKYQQNEFLAFRLDLMDNLALGGGHTLETVNNWSVTAGLEFRFGGGRRAYWPWNPGRGYW
jgi:hypothetical protein